MSILVTDENGQIGISSTTVNPEAVPIKIEQLTLGDCNAENKRSVSIIAKGSVKKEVIYMLKEGDINPDHLMYINYTDELGTLFGSDLSAWLEFSSATIGVSDGTMDSNGIMNYTPLSPIASCSN